jgi:hypothetical protein
VTAPRAMPSSNLEKMNARSKLRQHRLCHGRGDRQLQLRGGGWKGAQEDGGETVADTGAVGAQELAPLERCRTPLPIHQRCQLPSTDAMAVRNVLHARVHARTLTHITYNGRGVHKGY